MKLHQMVSAMRGRVVSGRLFASTNFTEICTDSRKISTGQVFVALQGETFDGHAFVVQAVQLGALAVVVNQDWQIPSTLPADALIISVENTREALGWFAYAWRMQFEVQALAITGSCGKTTVKECLRAILSNHAATLATEGNFNNEIGAPLTLLRLKEHHHYAVIELGASHVGDILYTSRWVQPQVAILLNAAPAHLEKFGSLAAVVRTKGEILTYIQPQGVAVINGDDAHLNDWLAQHPKLGARLLFSLRADRQTTAGLAHVWLKHAEQTAGQLRCVIGIADLIQAGLSAKVSNGELVIHSHLQGQHNIANMLAAVAAALAVAVPVEMIAQGLASMRAVAGRLQTLPGWRDGVWLLNDSYNANPHSVSAAIDVLASQAGQRILVLGQMAELGEDTESWHHQMGVMAKSKGIDQVFAVGQSAAATLAGFAGQSISDLANQPHQALDLAQIAEILRNQTFTPLTILIKGSRSAGMERLLMKLVANTHLQTGNTH